MSKQKFFHQFSGAENVAKNFFRTIPLDDIEIGVKKLDENFLTQTPHIETYHSQSFCRDNGRRVWLIYSEDFFVEVNPMISMESATNPGSYQEIDEGMQVWEKILVQGIPEYIVEVNYDFDYDNEKDVFKVVVHKMMGVVELENVLLKISRRNAPPKAHEAAKNFCGEHGCFLRGFIYSPASEESGEEVVVAYRWGSALVRIE